MRRTFAAGVLVAALAAGYFFVQAGNLEPPGPPAPTMKTLAEVEPRTPIHASDLPLTITGPGSYYLAENINTSGDGITVEADNVTVDLMGFSLSGGTGDGITTSGLRKNLTVKNGTVSGWSGAGLHLQADHSLVVDVHAEGNGGRGIFVNPNSIVMRSTAASNGSTGITASAGSTIMGCTARENGNAGITGSSTTTILGCTAVQNAGLGISVGAGSRVSDCTAAFNDDDGIRAQVGSMISGCTVYLNDMDGIDVDKSTTVVGNNCERNSLNVNGAAIVARGRFNRIERNNVTTSNRGIWILSDRNVVVGNSALANTINYDIVAGNVVGTIVTSEAAMNAASNSLVNIDF